MAKRSVSDKYIESMLSFLLDNTKGLERELMDALNTLRINKIKWTGKTLVQKGVKKKRGQCEIKGKKMLSSPQYVRWLQV